MCSSIYFSKEKKKEKEEPLSMYSSISFSPMLFTKHKNYLF